MTFSRRGLLVLPLLAAGCSILPDRPNVPVRRYALSPTRPGAQTARTGAPVLQVRRVRAVPGLQDVGLRRLRADGAYDVAVYEEWIAAPSDLTDAALRAWLQASGLFSAVVPQGSRADADFVLEMQLTVLEARPAAGTARAALAGVLMREERLSSRVLGTIEAEAEAPLAANAGAPQQAAAMGVALGNAMGRVEAALASLAR